MRGWAFFVQGLMLLFSVSLAPASLQDAAAPAPSPQEGVCGDESYHVTLCFPGTPQNATCTYSVQTGTTLDQTLPYLGQLACPQDLLFQQKCTSMPGSMNIAFGKCNEADPFVEQRLDNTLDVAFWIDVLGLRTIQELGTLSVRGYAYQEAYPLLGINLFPNVRTVRPLPPAFNEILQNGQVSFSGLTVPPLPQLAKIPSGLSILNSADTDFASPPRFPLLTSVENGLNIAGCNSLRTLQGLEQLRAGTNIRNVQIINNLILSNMSALSGFFRCLPDGSTQLNASMPVGIIAAHPLPLQAVDHGCTLTTPGTFCEYIANDSRCPNGTEYVRNTDGTILRVYQMAPSLAPAPIALPTLPTLPSTNIG